MAENDASEDSEARATDAETAAPETDTPPPAAPEPSAEETDDTVRRDEPELPAQDPPKPEPAAPTSRRVLRPSEGVSGRANARMTLAGTALVFVVTLFAWGGAKVACNLHPPRYEAFKPAPLNRLTSTPKDAALEFHHRLALRDFKGAREIAAEDGSVLVDQAESACDDACLGERAERKEKTVTRAIVERREGPTAVVKAESFYQGNVDARSYRLKWLDRMWKVIGTAE
jgi:hypothetical protein